MKSLLLIPTAGLGNRLRAIAAGRRLAAKHGATLEIAWDWGNWTDLFEPIAGVTIGRRPLPRYADLRNIWPDRNKPVDARPDHLDLRAYDVFWDQDDQPLLVSDIAEWIPRPAKIVHDRVWEFPDLPEYLPGIHMRFGDHPISPDYSDIEVFASVARELLRSYPKIFLATGAPEKQADLFNRVGAENFVTYPKTWRTDTVKQWPRPFNLDMTVQDLVDLHLLARCQEIYGSFCSSYSEIAMTLSGKTWPSKSHYVARNDRGEIVHIPFPATPEQCMQFVKTSPDPSPTYTPPAPAKQ